MKSFADQLADLQSHPRYAGATSRPFEGGHLITLPNVSLPPGWSHQTATLMFYVGPHFPAARPDGFWSVESIKYRTQSGYEINPQFTRTTWDPFPPEAALRWLWRPTHWSANSDTLLTYTHVIQRRFNDIS